MDCDVCKRRKKEEDSGVVHLQRDSIVL
jgi:hypothetical protein